MVELQHSETWDKPRKPQKVMVRMDTIPSQAMCVCECFSERHHAKSLKCSKLLFQPFPELSNLRQKETKRKKKSSTDSIS